MVYDIIIIILFSFITIGAVGGWFAMIEIEGLKRRVKKLEKRRR
jgi:hypothetical protein